MNIFYFNTIFAFISKLIEDRVPDIIDAPDLTYPRVRKIRYPEVPLVVVMVVDTKSEDDYQALKIMKYFKDRDITIIPVGISPFVNLTELQRLSSKGRFGSIHLANYVNLVNTTEYYGRQLYNVLICNQRKPEHRTFGITSVDDEGNESPISNLFSVVIPPRIRKGMIQWMEVDPEVKPDSLTSYTKRSVSAAAITVPLLIALAILACILLVGWKRRQDREKNIKDKQQKKKTAKEKLADFKSKLFND